MRRKVVISILICLLVGCNSKSNSNPDPEHPDSPEYVVGAYTMSGLPDPFLVTHIFYAFGHVNAKFTGIYVNNPTQMKNVVALKKQNPNLKVLLSLGGAGGCDGFSEMAKDPELRTQFIDACDKYCESYGLDGIDLDWEFPQQSENGNYIVLVKEMRKKFGKKRLLTMASGYDAAHCSLRLTHEYFDFINIMSYDMGQPPYYNAPLYPSANSKFSTKQSLDAHLACGVPKNKLVLGAPFYGRCRSGVGLPSAIGYNSLGNYTSTFTRKWDDDAKVPYYVDSSDQMMISYDDEESLKYKAEFAADQGLLGVMYWQFNQDNTNQTLTRTMYESFVNARKK